MTLDLSKFEELVEQGYLRKSEKDGLILFGYTDKCTFDRHWNEYTLQARGLILEKSTGKVIAKPFEKFFNLNEMPETQFVNLPKESYIIMDKADGSLGIIFNYEGKWQVATRGSFYSEQAQKAQEMLKKYNLDGISEHVTVLVEIIYPENKVIVDYGKEEKLVLLGAYDRRSGEEYSYAVLEIISNVTDIPLVTMYTMKLEEAIRLQKTIPKNQEGFVVWFFNGLRVKIKGEEYLRIAKLISHLSPIAIWETMKCGKVDRAYLEQLPEEFRQDYEQIVRSLEESFVKIKLEIEEDLSNLPTKDLTPEARKTIGLFLSSTEKIKHKQAIFPTLLGQDDVAERYVMKLLRPDGNKLK